jgi:nucleolar GTP-binding protein
LTKVDLCPYSEVEQAGRALIEEFRENNPTIEIIELSSNDDALIENLKAKACDKLLEFRQSTRKGLTGLKTDEDYLRGVSIILPKNVNGKNRGPCIPDSVITERQSGTKEKRQTLKDIQEEQGGAGVFNFPWNEHFMLTDDAWKYDKVPEILNGMNIADYVDPEIEAKLQALEEDHERLLNMQDEEMIDEEEEEDKDALKQVKNQRALNMLDSRLTKNNRVSKNRTTLASLKDRLAQKGKNSKKVNQRMISLKERSTQRKLKNQNGMEIEDKKVNSIHKRQRDTERAKWMKEGTFVEKKRRKIQKMSLKDGQMGDADRHIYTKKPRHLYSGKLGRGKTDWR